MNCPSCGQDLVQPFGRANSNVLIVGEFPGREEISRHQPWVGEAGEVLRQELSRVGIAYSDCRATNLWLHEKVGKKDEHYAGCNEFAMQHLYSELLNANAVLVCGSEAVEFLFNKKVMAVCGLNLPILIAPQIKIAVACPNPAIALHEVVGDLRFAIEQFAALTKQLRKENRNVRRNV